jgi:hypothetical protein
VYVNDKGQCAQELANDPLGILRPPAKLQHALPLASAYAAAGDARDADGRRRVRLDPKHHEPKARPLTLRGLRAGIAALLGAQAPSGV